MMPSPVRAVPQSIPELADQTAADAQFEIDAWFAWRRADLKQRLNSLMIEFLPEHASVRTADAVAVETIKAVDYLYECERKQRG